MALDRTGDEVPQHSCRKGWAGTDDEGRPIPCLVCKPHLRKTAESNDISERPVSARAQQAIERANQGDTR